VVVVTPRGSGEARTNVSVSKAVTYWGV